MRVAIGFGTSLGNRRGQITQAILKLAHQPKLRLLAASKLYRTPPMRGGTAKNDFLNAVAVFDTELRPQELLELCQQIEHQFGRRRAKFWGDRPIDLDLLCADCACVDSPPLTLPHPAIAKRPFVHQPLLEVWPDVLDQRTQTPLKDLERTFTPRPWPVGIVKIPKSVRTL